MDWTGNAGCIYRTLGASNHTEQERQGEDYYATDPMAIDKLEAAFRIPTAVWECACGAGHLADRLLNYGHILVTSDIVDRGYAASICDFLKVGFNMLHDLEEDCCILTNPPYRYATEFVEHALALLPIGAPAIFLLKTTALEGKGRWERLYRHGWLHEVYQFRDRLLCAKNGDFEAMRHGGGSAVSYAWFIFRKVRRNAPTINWI